MVTEKPPRRPKTQKKPVTIDLSAEEAAVVAEPVRSNDTDKTSPTTGEAPWGDNPPAETQPATDRLADETPAAEMETAADAIPEPAPETKAGFGAGPKAEETAGSVEDQAKPAIGPPIPAESEREPDKKQAATSTLVAAGIFGGIVALALAGSMQYAGFIPGGSNGSTVPDEIAALRQQVEALNRAPAVDPELATRLQAVEDALTQTGESDTAERLANVERELATVKSTAESAAADSSARLDAAEARLNEPGEDAIAARAIAAAALKAAIDRGGAFTAELDTFASVSPDDAAVAELRALAETGVASRSQLVEQFSAASDAILQSVEQPDPDQGIGSRLMSSALSVVKVRRTGDVEGDAPDALVARIDNALKSGDLPAAATEWEKLPDVAKAASQDFKTMLDARIAVDALIGDSLARAVNATATQN